MNLTLWGFASVLPTAMAGSGAVPKPHPDPRAQQGGCICWALPGSCCPAAPCQGLEKLQASESLVLVLFVAFQKDISFQNKNTW